MRLTPTRKMRGGENTEQEGSMQDGLHAPNRREGLQCTYTLRWLAALVCYAPGHPFECCRARQAPRYRISGKSKDKDFFSIGVGFRVSDIDNEQLFVHHRITVSYFVLGVRIKLKQFTLHVYQSNTLCTSVESW
jgi:hypothetical protein